MKKVAILNAKGGVGKTTTAFMLAWCAAQHGLRVLVQDADPQGSITSWVDAAGGDVGFDCQAVNALMLRRRVPGYDLVIVDSAPGYSEMSDAIITTSDLIIIPTQCSYADLERTLSVASVAISCGVKYRIVLTQVQRSATKGLSSTRELLASNNLSASDVIIPARVDLAYTFGHNPTTDYGYEELGRDLRLWS